MPVLPHIGTCGHPRQEVAAATGCAILTSYLFLFIGFYLATYKKKPSMKKTARRASKTEVPSMIETSELAADALRSASHAIVETVSEEKCAVSL